MGGRPGIAALIALAALGGGWTFEPAAAPTPASEAESPMPAENPRPAENGNPRPGDRPRPPETPRPAVLRIASTVTPDPMIIGAESVYTLTVTNLGNGDATDAVITDVLDQNVSPGPLPGDCLLTNRTITCGGPGLTIPAGQRIVYDIPVTTEPTLQDGTKLTNRAHITALDTNPAETRLLTRTQARADLELRNSAATSPGGTITYTLTVTNHGPSQATDVTVQGPGQAKQPSECGQGRSCPLGPLAPDESRTLTYTIAPGTTGLIETCATVHAAARDDRTADNSSCARTMVEPAQPPSQSPAPAPPQPAPSPSHHERQAVQEDKGAGPARHEPRQDDSGTPPAAARAEEPDVPPPAHHRDDTTELPLTGASVWMLGLGVAVLMAIGLLVRFFSRQERDDAGRPS
ncbi:DUF11 domain-containing protein [Nonomuraea sp. NPDC050404]|uniref:DUF11 domain-containing protein n=1 Tax=Nonomuraea sp. NPDC050404 TaxID=3155783 RepID=UPI0033D7605B